MSVRALIFHPDFVHRVNDIGTVDSICLHCFATIASLPKETGLEQNENAHSCWQRVQPTSETMSGRVDPRINSVKNNNPALSEYAKDDDAEQLGTFG
jgi:hypothetical protein